jgi:hypothetical protein
MAYRQGMSNGLTELDKMRNRLSESNLGHSVERRESQRHQATTDYNKSAYTYKDTEEANLKSGGSYGEVRNEIQKRGEVGYEVHHMPANDVNGLSLYDGPAIKMEAADHRQTASCGNSIEARKYRAKQKELIDSGRFKEAFRMDVKDIRSKFGSKYDTAINQALQYVNKLEREGRV